MPARTRVLLDALIAKFTGEEWQAEEEKVQTAKKRCGLLLLAPLRPTRVLEATTRDDRDVQFANDEF